MREFEIGKDKKKILLVNNKGQFSALGPSCTHYGAPLVKGKIFKESLGERERKTNPLSFLFLLGVLCNGRIRCPWHGACFNATSGDIEDYPGLDSLPTYDTFVNDGMVKIRASESLLLKPGKRIKSMARKQVGDERTFLILGGGNHPFFFGKLFKKCKYWMLQ